MCLLYAPSAFITMFWQQINTCDLVIVYILVSNYVINTNQSQAGLQNISGSQPIKELVMYDLRRCEAVQGVEGSKKIGNN